MPPNDTADINRGHLHAARVGHDTARAFRERLGGHPVTAPPWRRLPRSEWALKARRLAIALEGDSDHKAIGVLLLGMSADEAVELAAAVEAYRELEGDPTVDHTAKVGLE